MEVQNAGDPKSPVGWLVQTSRMYLDKQKQFSLVRKFVPSADELLAITKLKPVRFQVKLMDGSIIELDADSWMTTEEAIYSLRNTLNFIGAGFELFRVYKSLELKLFPNELLCEMLAIHEDLEKKTKKELLEFYLIFKCAVFLKPREKWEDPMMDRLLLYQVPKIFNL